MIGLIPEVLNTSLTHLPLAGGQHFRPAPIWLTEVAIEKTRFFSGLRDTKILNGVHFGSPATMAQWP